MKSQFRYLNWESGPCQREFRFRYELVSEFHGRLRFEEIVRFPVQIKSDAVSDSLCNMLHIALGFSYYKTFVPSLIEQPYALNGMASDFWNECLNSGMAEFLMTNRLHFSRLAKFYPSVDAYPSVAVDASSLRDDTPLLGMGGGKDSIVAGEILKLCGKPPTCFVFATGDHAGQAQAVTQVMGVKQLVVERYIDRTLFSLNAQSGTYNGHVPFSLFVALTGTLLAYSSGQRYCCVGNELSSSTDFAEWDGRVVNHQWSKSYRFEQLFNQQLRVIHPQLSYFSVVRPMSSVAIGKIFSGLPNYFDVFSSDSTNMRSNVARRPTTRWTLESAKTLSTAILLGPWLDEDDMRRIFGQSLLNNRQLFELLKSLLGLASSRPMDCVGTPEELQACCIAIENRADLLHTALIDELFDEGLIQRSDRSVISTFLDISADNCFPEQVRDSIYAASRGLLA